LTDKSQHGGKRPGAGRKFAHGEPTTSVQIRMPNSLLASINNEAASKDISRNQMIIEALVWVMTDETFIPQTSQNK